MEKDYITPGERLENTAVAARRKAAREAFDRKHPELRLKNGAPIIGLHIADVTGDPRPHRARHLAKNLLGGALALVLMYLFAIFGLAL